MGRQDAHGRELSISIGLPADRAHRTTLGARAYERGITKHINAAMETINRDMYSNRLKWTPPAQLHTTTVLCLGEAGAASVSTAGIPVVSVEDPDATAEIAQWLQNNVIFSSNAKSQAGHAKRTSKGSLKEGQIVFQV